MKRVLIVVAQKEFHDSEYEESREYFDEIGFDVFVASEREGEAIGIFGKMIHADLSFHNVIVHDYDAFIFIGGHGVIELWHNFALIHLVRDASKQNKILAAISIAPVILAVAGVLKDKKATSIEEGFNRLVEGGAILAEGNVVVDDNIITANSSSAVDEFCKKIIEVIHYEKIF